MRCAQIGGTVADHPETTAPWGSLPGDKDDPNYGRECVRCGGAVRAGGRYAHVCAPTHPETTALRLAEAATPGPWYLSLAGDYAHRPRAPGPRAGMATAPGGMPCDCGHDLDLAALAAVDAEG